MAKIVLDDVKASIPVSPEVTDFDENLVLYSNLAIDTMTQLGRSCKNIDLTTEWDDMMDDMGNLAMVKTYICLNVKMMFDPPANSTAANAINEKIKELEFRLQIKEDS